MAAEVIRRALLALGSAAGLLLAHPAAAIDIPAEIAGDWVVVSLAGEDPAFLQLSQPSEIVGKHITVSGDRVALWTELSGHPGAVRTHDGSLSDVVSATPEARAAHDFNEAHAALRFYEVGLLDCAEGGKTLAGGCPTIVFAQDPATGIVSFVPFAWSLAKLERVKPAQ